MTKTDLHTDDLKASIWKLLADVTDPEIPVLSVLDLGIVREISVENGLVEVVITPTYSGCPAMDFIGRDIRKKLTENGYSDCRISQRLSPAWTTDWMTDEGRQKLKAYGIAPPVPGGRRDLQKKSVACPRCHGFHTELISEFGSTACKALYRCMDCGEPFDYFKCH